MELRTLFVAVGAAIAGFLVVAVAVIELLAFEFSALVGLPAGLLAGLVVLAAVLTRHGAASEPLRWLAAGAAGFGYGIVLALGANYVNLADVGFETTVAVGVGAAAVAALATALTGRRDPGAST